MAFPCLVIFGFLVFQVQSENHPREVVGNIPIDMHTTCTILLPLDIISLEASHYTQDL